MIELRNTRPGGAASQAGYTLLELLVVLGIIAALTALVAPQVIRYLGEAKSDSAKVQVQNLQSALELYYLDTGSYPTTEQGLTALIADTNNLAGWKGPYLKRKEGIEDPWGRQYVYKLPGEHGTFDLYSFGRDGAQGGSGEDSDVVNW
jgi:general secretion pathway protein G